MRIATWNVNSVRTRLDRVLLWLQEHEPDVLCMQETKVVDEDFPREGFEELGYQVSIHGQKAYSGVAIASRMPVSEVEVGLPLDDDEEARGIAVTVGGVRIVDVYVPNGGEVGSEKYAYKLRWLDALGEWIEGHAAPSDALVVTGDYNIAPDDRDVWDAELYRGQVLCTDEERARFQSLLRWGLTDALRAVNDEASVYTQWDYRGAAFRFNQGVRIDHLLVSESVRARLQAVELSRDDRKVRAGVAKPSDHIPVTLVLKD